MSVMSGSLRRLSRAVAVAIVLLGALMAVPSQVAAQGEPGAATEAAAERSPGGEVNLVLPDLGAVDVGGYSSRALLMGGLLVAALGIGFGLLIMSQLKNMPV